MILHLDVYIIVLSARSASLSIDHRIWLLLQPGRNKMVYNLGNGAMMQAYFHTIRKGRERYGNAIQQRPTAMGTLGSTQRAGQRDALHALARPGEGIELPDARRAVAVVG